MLMLVGLISGFFFAQKYVKIRLDSPSIYELPSLTYLQVELAPPSPGEIPVAVADLSTKIANAQKQTFRSWTVSIACLLSPSPGELTIF